MRRILPASFMAGFALAACTATDAGMTPPAVVPANDARLYACAQHAAASLGFARQLGGAPGASAFLATTDTDRVSGVYDALSVRVLSDSGGLATWVTASPYTGRGNGRILPSRRALDAATQVERRCRDSSPRGGTR
ncbi:MAG TPA: hypothetical protein VFT41_03325 [Gemmatimonadaceae bacterium]|nr:hypothetical protein [Gemmatimonadaceae bacterium]